MTRLETAEAALKAAEAAARAARKALQAAVAAVLDAAWERLSVDQRLAIVYSHGDLLGALAKDLGNQDQEGRGSRDAKKKAIKAAMAAEKRVAVRRAWYDKARKAAVVESPEEV